MEEMQKVIDNQNSICEDTYGLLSYCLMTADAPLYAQMERIIHEADDGERNQEFPNIIALPGQMHQSMAIQDVVKQIVYDAGMDSLASGAGFSPSLIELFRGKKGLKTNLNLLRETAVVWAI